MMNHAVPDLGQIAQRAKVGVSLSAFVRELDHDGVVEMRVVNGQNGPQAVPDRTQLVDAEQLVEMFVSEMRKELRAFAVRIGREDAAL